MPATTGNKSSPSVIAARCTAKLKRKVLRAAERINRDESTILRVALEEFLLTHRTAESIGAAVIKSHTLSAEASQ